MLRFSRLFGPGKVSSLPQIWRTAKKLAKQKRKRHRDGTSDSDSEGDHRSKKSDLTWALNYGDAPPQSGCYSDDEVPYLLGSILSKDLIKMLFS